MTFEKYTSNPHCQTRALYIGDELIYNLVIPGDVKEISKYAFYHCSIHYVTIEEGVTTIGSNAFEGCKGFTTLMLDNAAAKLDEIGSNAFLNCSNITTAALPATIDKIGWQRLPDVPVWPTSIFVERPYPARCTSSLLADARMR